MTPTSLRIIFLLSVALVSVSTSSIFVRMLPSIPAVVIAFWRMGTAGLMLWGTSAIKPQGSLPGGTRLKLVFAGIFLGFHFACFFGAVKLTSIANATLLGTTAPFFTAIIETLFLKRPVHKKLVLGLGLAFIGGFIVYGNHFNITESSALGNYLALIGSLWLAVVWILAESIRQTTKTLVFSRAVYLIAAGTLFIISIVMNTSVIAFTPKDLIWFLALGLIPTIFGHTLFSYIVKYVSPTVVASVPLGEPVIASLLAWGLFSEIVPLQTLVGGLFTLCGLYMITVRSSLGRFQHDNL